ncbi:MAG: hypothetical protein IKN42_07475, partial [Elusimicrobia bacterium]|nr:hypothetical protein [Elusimicrobiota bacterium]
MKNVLSFMLMMLLAVCVSSCKNYAIPDDMDPVIIVTPAPDSEQAEETEQEPAPEPEPEPQPQPE